MSKILIDEATVQQVPQQRPIKTFHGGKAWPVQEPAQQEPVYHLRQYGDVTKEQLDRYMATGDIYPQPAQHLPDAIHHTDTSEHPEYISGWNDCREAMKGMK